VWDDEVLSKQQHFGRRLTLLFHQREGSQIAQDDPSCRIERRSGCCDSCRLSSPLPGCAGSLSPGRRKVRHVWIRPLVNVFWDGGVRSWSVPAPAGRMSMCPDAWSGVGEVVLLQPFLVMRIEETVTPNWNIVAIPIAAHFFGGNRVERKELGRHSSWTSNSPGRRLLVAFS
jgi:hypothetical protein